MTLKLLIVVDDDADRNLVKRAILVANADAQILEAKSWKDMQSIMSSNRLIDCVFLDYKLPDADGLEILKKIYIKEQKLAPFPIVMLTGQGDETVTIQAIRYGAQDYLVKDNLSSNSLYIALTKAREAFALKDQNNASKKILEHSQKMGAVGQLTSGIAHDFNNLLTIIFGNISLLESAIDNAPIDGQYMLEKIGMIKRTSHRGADLIKRLMVFSRQRELEPVVCDLNNIVIEVENLLRRSLGDVVQIQTHLDKDIYPIYIDPGQLEHAIINMGVNARDAMQDGGTFSLSTKNIEIDEEIALACSIAQGSYASLEISDTGHGMDEETLSKIFDPFFTTKDVDQGTGLGLSMVYGFIKDSQSGIFVESKQDRGTCFKLYFPRNFIGTPAYTDDKETVNGQLPLLSSGQTILLVEDEEQIRSITSMLLKQKGYTVIEASNGQEALDIMVKKSSSIDLVFTDVAMPGEINGVQMAARAEAFPDMALTRQRSVLKKPYTHDKMLEKVYTTLNRL